ncbi:MAG TPA: hypothetical protein VKP30_03890, partial [Polyangiaceae bacterium]|nr:hypothetical protein [Polyangiaceae bacterium]
MGLSVLPEESIAPRFAGGFRVHGYVKAGPWRFRGVSRLTGGATEPFRRVQSDTVERASNLHAEIAIAPLDGF